MKLTDSDKNYLISIGYNNNDLTEIENATNNMRYNLYFTTDNNLPSIRVTKKQVVCLIGQNAFLSGIGRATFHATASKVVESSPNVAIGFSYTKWGK